MNADDFTGAGLCIEPVYGARSFDVDSLGRLNAVSYDYVWRPGENEAACKKQGRLSAGGVDLRHLQAVINAYPTYSTSTWVSGATVGEFEVEDAEPPPHEVKDCSCGFYSYFDNSADYHDHKRVNAVIEGYGETIIGTRGFRSQKARIVALHIPAATLSTEPRTSARHRFRHWCDRSASPFLPLGFLFAMLCVVGLAAVLGWDENGLGLTIGLGTLGAGAVISLILGLIGMSVPWGCCKPTDSASIHLPTATADKVRRNYDGIPVYPTFEAMVAAHPLTPPAEPQPSDEDFWTRSAS